MITFDSKAQLEKALATQIASDLSSAIQQKGSATLLLSGGNTPSGVYRLLSIFDIDWSKVFIGLVDERFVAADSPFSNYKLLNETIAANSAKNVVIHPMVVDADNYEENLKKSEAVYRIFTEPDVCLLGMGPDGHTASIFPNDFASEQANFDERSLLSNTNAPSEPTQRITFNGPVLRRTKSLYLMFTGAQKKDIFNNSNDLNLPIGQYKEALKATYYTSAT